MFETVTAKCSTARKIKFTTNRWTFVDEKTTLKISLLVTFCVIVYEQSGIQS